MWKERKETWLTVKWALHSQQQREQRFARFKLQPCGKRLLFGQASIEWLPQPQQGKYCCHLCDREEGEKQFLSNGGKKPMGLHLLYICLQSHCAVLFHAWTPHSLLLPSYKQTVSQETWKFLLRWDWELVEEEIRISEIIASRWSVHLLALI